MSLERTAIYNRAHYARLETLTTDDTELEAMALPIVTPMGDDDVLAMLWLAQNGNIDYPFAPRAVPVKHNHCRGCGDKNCRRADTYGAQAV